MDILGPLKKFVSNIASKKRGKVNSKHDSIKTIKCPAPALGTISPYPIVVNVTALK